MANSRSPDRLDRLYQSRGIDDDPLESESDRGCVLILAAEIEKRLEECLREWYENAKVLSKKEIDGLLDFTGPAGTLAGKINICAGIGFIKRPLHADLLKLKKIRNNAAHDGGSFSFANSSVRDIVRTMEGGSLGESTMPHYEVDNIDSGLLRNVAIYQEAESQERHFRDFFVSKAHGMLVDLYFAKMVVHLLSYSLPRKYQESVDFIHQDSARRKN